MPRRIGLASWLVLGAMLASGQTAAADDSAARRSLRSAHGFLQRGMVAAAMPEYEAALSGGLGVSERDEALYGLSVCLVRMAQWERALESLGGISGALGFPFADDAAMLRAQCSMMLGDFAGAAEAVRPIIERPDPGPHGPAAWAIRIECLFRAGSLEDAAAEWDRSNSRRRGPDGASRAVYYAARAMYELGRVDDAIAALESAPAGTVDDPLRDHREMLLARCCAERGRDDDAARRYRGVAERSGSALAPDAMLALSRLLADRGGVEEATGWLTRLLEEHGSSRAAPAATIDLARIMADSGSFDEARRLAAHAKTIGDEGVRLDAERLLARCELETGEPEKAATRLRALADRLHGQIDAGTLYDLGLAEWRAGRLDAAGAAFERVLKVASDDGLRADAMFALVGVAQETNDDASIIAFCGRFAEAHGEDPRVWRCLLIAGSTHERAGNDEQAEGAYRSVIARGAADDRARAALRLGLLQHRVGRSEESASTLAPLAVTDKPDFAPALLALGDLAAQAGKADEATVLLERYLRLAERDPGRPDAMLMLGRIEHERGGFDAAAAWFARVEEEWNGTTAADHARLGRASALAALGRLEESERALVDACASGDAAIAVHALRRLAEAAMARGDAPTAASRYEEAAARVTGLDRGELLLRMAQSHADAGDADAADEAFGRVIRESPDERIGSEASARRGLMRIATGREEEGRQDLEQAIDTLAAGPLRDAVQIERARGLRAAGDGAGAERVLKEVITAATDGLVRATAGYELAALMIEREEREDAADALDAALREIASSGDASPVELRGAVVYLAASNALALGRDAQAAALTQEFEEPSPRDDLAGPIALVRGEALRRLGRFTEAAQVLARAVDDADPAVARVALLKRGDALASAQQWEESERVFAEFRRRFADDELWFQAAFGAAWAIENQGRPADAIEHYRRVAEGHDGETAARAQFQIGECLYALGRHDEAVRELLKVDILFSSADWSAAALYEAGRCLGESGDPAGARRRFEEVIERFGGTRWAGLARKELGVTTEVRGD